MDKKLANILANVFNMRLTDVNTSLAQHEIIKWDSLTHMDLITAIEKAYAIELSMEEILEMTSVSNILLILKNHGFKSDA